MKWSTAALPALLALTACIDFAGPRPRPTGVSDSLPPDGTTPELLWYEMQPRVITTGASDTARITVAVTGSPDAVQLITRSAEVIALTRGANGLYTGRIPPATLLFDYHTGDLRNVVGAFVLQKPDNSSQSTLTIDVKDATVPVVDPVSLGTGIQATTHVVNIRYDNIFAGEGLPAAPIKAFYSVMPDDFHFLSVIEQVQSPREPQLTLVRNQVRGIGAPIIDGGRAYGSNTLLEAIIDFPRDAGYDPAQTSNIRELGRRWMNYLALPSVSAAQPHWPLSDIANGIMGLDDPQTHTSVSFPYDVVAQGDGTYVLHFTDVPRTFNDLELYLMGLIPADSVRPHVVFQNQNQRGQIRDGGVLQGPVDSVTVAKILAAEGVRLPSSATAPRQFRMGTIVLSRGTLLSRNEMSFFEFMAKRGEAQSELPYFTGATRGITLPFNLATNGRATLNTNVRPGN